MMLTIKQTTQQLKHAINVYLADITIVYMVYSQLISKKLHLNFDPN